MTLPRPKKHADPVTLELELQEAIRRFNDTYDITQLFSGLIPKGVEFHAPCPKCGGVDRFIIEPKKSKAWCRQCTAWGDTLHWAIVMAGLDPEEKGITTKFLKEKELL